MRSKLQSQLGQRFISNINILIMSRRPYKGSNQDLYGANQSSNMELAYGSPQGHRQGNSQPYGMQPEQDANIAYQMQRQEMKKAKKEDLEHLYKQDYQPAKYKKAVEYKNSRSYKKKLPSGHYKSIDTFQDTAELKQFGLGIYFYIQFGRRMTWLFFFCFLVQAITIYINWLGTGMSAYAQSFSTYLIKSTNANYTENKFTQYDGYIVTIAPAASYLALLFFYFIWKGHYFGTINEQEEDNSDVKPEKFCLEIQGLDNCDFNEDQLKTFFSAFGPVYEVSLIRRFKNKLEYFEELDELEEEIKEEELEIVLGGGDKQNLRYLKKEREKLNKYINKLQIFPKTLSAFVHFQYQKSKADCLTYFNNHYLFDSCTHNCMRCTCCCCIDSPEQKYLLHGQKLVIKNEKVPTPEDIQWQHFEVSSCSKVFRVLFSFLIILVFLLISCTVIGLCSLYISANSGSCEGLTIPATAADATATNNGPIIQCFCDSNLLQSFSDPNIQAACVDYRDQIMISQGIQYAVIFTSAITNFIFGAVVGKLVNCVRPASKSSGMLTKIVIYTVFLIFNTVFVPVLIYADIFGFTPSQYVSLITIVSSDVSNFFSYETLSFYPDFNTTWYRNVSSIFVNFLAVDTIVTWLFLLIDKCFASHDGLQDDEGKILQKHMNNNITSYKLNIYKEISYMYLVIFMCALFWAGVPVLVPMGFLSIFSRYVVTRILIQNDSSRIEGMGEEFMSFSLTLLAVILIICPVIGCWMLVANSQIYPDKLNMAFPIFNGLMTELDKELYLPFYIIMSLLIMAEFFLYNTIIRFISCCCSLCYEKKETARPQHTRPFVEYTKGMNIVHSYNIRNNDEMRNVILNLQKYLVDKEMD